MTVVEESCSVTAISEEFARIELANLQITRLMRTEIVRLEVELHSSKQLQHGTYNYLQNAMNEITVIRQLNVESQIDLEEMQRLNKKLLGSRSWRYTKFLRSIDMNWGLLKKGIGK